MTKSDAEKSTSIRPGWRAALATGLVLVGMLVAVSSYSTSYTYRESYLACYALQSEPEGVSTALDALSDAQSITFPYGVACSWEMEDGTTVIQLTHFVADSIALVVGLALIAAGFVVGWRLWMNGSGASRRAEPLSASAHDGPKSERDPQARSRR